MTDKKLPADVDRRFNERYSWNHDRVPYYILEDDAKEFLADELAKAVVEERARVRENLPKIITPTVEPPPNNLSQNQIFASGQMNMLLRVTDLLSSLDKSVTKKD